jgi:pimeloyl-ACP methyl ester carboxylesterase
MVFDAAVVPEAGKSVRDQFSADPSMFHPDWIASGPRWLDRGQHAALAREFLFHDLADPTQALRTIEMFDTRHLVTEPNPLTRWPPAARASIVPAQDRTITPDWQRRAARERLRVEPIEIDAGHLPHTTRPAQFARILEEILQNFTM